MTENTYQTGYNGADGYWYPWSNSLWSWDINRIQFGDNSGDGWYRAFARWTGINIPANAVIVSAKLQVYVNSVDNGAEVRIYFNDVASPSTPWNSAAAEALTLTSNSVLWTFSSSTGWVDSPDISYIIRELYASHGPYSSGSMMVVLHENSQSQGKYVSNAGCANRGYGPKLVIEWAYPAGCQHRIIGMML